MMMKCLRFYFHHFFSEMSGVFCEKNRTTEIAIIEKADSGQIVNDFKIFHYQ